MESYRDLRVWQHGMDLAEVCYHATDWFPRREMFGLTAQIRRAASSVPANTAEGYGRDSRGEYVQFLRISQGSLKELETHILLAKRLVFGEPPALEEALDRADQTGRMLRALYRSLQRKSRDAAS